MLDNLKQHGTVFNLNDDQNYVDNLLNTELEANLQVTEHPEPTSDVTFEDED